MVQQRVRNGKEIAVDVKITPRFLTPGINVERCVGGGPDHGGINSLRGEIVLRKLKILALRNRSEEENQNNNQEIDGNSRPSHFQVTMDAVTAAHGFRMSHSIPPAIVLTRLILLFFH